MWLQEQVIEIDRLQGPLTGIEGSDDGLSFVSRSEYFTQVWDRVFDLESADKRVLKQSKVCLSIDEGISPR